MSLIKKAALKEMLKINGVERVSDEAVDMYSEILEAIVEADAKVISSLVTHAKRVTVKPVDIKFVAGN
ncbi:histone H3/H4 [Methanococcus maripaludis]|uniref:Histone H3/H4 n=1 Tax=Methanococcus maripaludis TaxID=39152 RepID=A0A7J9NWF5_METMI|nr:histone-like protein [Methanococcus maripaludis]MBA2851657.1 histone H3/H4 [Methanococcus maripaludis]